MVLFLVWVISFAKIRTSEHQGDFDNFAGVSPGSVEKA